jgi:hypothetical protein
METPKEYYYTYYSYEEWGRGYFGSRGCKCLPEKDVKYFGSFKDKTFKPTQKIILKSDYATREEAYTDEIILQKHYKVIENPHFANRAYQTSTKFYVPKEQAIENGKRSGKLGGRKTYELGVGIFSRSKEKISEDSRKSGSIGGKIGGKIAGHKTYELKLGVHSLTKEQRKENGIAGGKKALELGVGVFGMSKEERFLASSKGGTKAKENKVGLFSLTKEQRKETGKKSAEKVNAQRWECCETGYVSTAAGVVSYQKGRGIDTSKSNRRRIV